MPDHSRERGEHCNAPWSVAGTADHPRDAGNTPRMALSVSMIRIIPASAGNTRIASLPRRFVRIIPRARGTRIREREQATGLRIIPASAGNTRSPERCGPSRADHPRERGEHIGAGLRKAGRRGSSPRARGTRVMTPKVGRCGRIIPASAGNTCRKASCMAPHPDHPRERGEHDTRRVSTCSKNGSSPRARGTLHPIIQNGAGFRIIPASAGNTALPKTLASS